MRVMFAAVNLPFNALPSQYGDISILLQRRDVSARKLRERIAQPRSGSSCAAAGIQQTQPSELPLCVTVFVDLRKPSLFFSANKFLHLLRRIMTPKVLVLLVFLLASLVTVLKSRVVFRTSRCNAEGAFDTCVAYA